MLLNLLENWLASHIIPARISLLVKDLAFMKTPGMTIDGVRSGKKRENNCAFL